MKSVWHKLTFAADTLSLHRIPGLEIWEDRTSVSHLAAGLAFASSGSWECFLKVPLTSLLYFQCALKHPSRYLGNTKTWAKRKALLTPARQSPNPNISQRIIRKSYKHQNCNAEKDRTLSSSLCVLLLVWSLVGKILPQLLPSRTFHWTWAFLSYYPILSPPLENCDLLFDLKTEHLWLKDNKIQNLVSVNCWNPDLVWLYLTLKKERKNPTDKHSSAFLSPKMRMKKTQTAGKLHWGRSSWSSSHGKARYLFKDRTEFQQTQGNVKILHKQEEERIQLSLQPVHNE